MLFHEAVNNLEHYLQNNTNHHYFVGFNALNKAEELIIQEFLTAKQGNVIWDIDRFFMKIKFILQENLFVNIIANGKL